jgi:hypothetical protein
MAHTVTFTLQFPWQHSFPVTASTDEPLIEVLTRSGYPEIPHYEFLVAVKGLLVNPEFSVSFCGIQTGSRVVLLQRRIKDGSRAREFLATLEQPWVTYKPAQKDDKAPEQRRGEIARMVDRALLRIDFMKKASIICEELKNEMDRRRECAEGERLETVIEFDAKISEAPLPMLFEDELSV